MKTWVEISTGKADIMGQKIAIAFAPKPTEIETAYTEWLALEEEREDILDADDTDPRERELDKRAITAANRVMWGKITTDRDALLALAVAMSFAGNLNLREPSENTEDFIRILRAANVPMRRSAYPPPSKLEKLYRQWLAAERAWADYVAANPDDIAEGNSEGPLAVAAEHARQAVLDAPVWSERDALCRLALQCSPLGALCEDPNYPLTCGPDSLAATFRAIALPVRDW